MRQRTGEPADGDAPPLLVEAAQDALDAVGLAHEARHEDVGRRLVEIARRPFLRDDRVVHHDDPVRDSQRLLLIVCHVDDGDPESPLERSDLLAHLPAQARVQIRQRLVEQ